MGMVGGLVGAHLGIVGVVALSAGPDGTDPLRHALGGRLSSAVREPTHRAVPARGPTDDLRC